MNKDYGNDLYTHVHFSTLAKSPLINGTLTMLSETQGLATASERAQSISTSVILLAKGAVSKKNYSNLRLFSFPGLTYCSIDYMPDDHSEKLTILRDLWYEE